MGKVIVGMTISLDGFVNDRNGSVERLFPDLAALRETELLQEDIRTTGAVVMGKRAFEMGDPDSYAGNYEFQVPIFVLTHHVPDKHPQETAELTFTFVTDGIESAIRQAKAAADSRDVMVIGGASTVQQVLNARLADELWIGIVPVLLGDGLRLFDQLDSSKVQLEQLDVLLSPGRTDIKYRVVR